MATLTLNSVKTCKPVNSVQACPDSQLVHWWIFATSSNQEVVKSDISAQLWDAITHNYVVLFDLRSKDEPTDKVDFLQFQIKASAKVSITKFCELGAYLDAVREGPMHDDPWSYCYVTVVRGGEGQEYKPLSLTHFEWCKVDAASLMIFEPLSRFC